MAMRIETEKLEPISRRDENLVLSIEKYIGADGDVHHGFYFRILEDGIEIRYDEIESELLELSNPSNLSSEANKIYEGLAKSSLKPRKNSQGNCVIYLIKPKVREIIKEMLEEYRKKLLENK
jgi:hypothetical protein